MTLFEWFRDYNKIDNVNQIDDREVLCKLPSISLSNTAGERNTQCLKIFPKVVFNIASEASYVYILRGQKLIKNAKNGSIWRVFENMKLAVKQSYQTGQF